MRAMGWFRRKKGGADSDAALRAQLEEIEAVNRRIAGDPGMQAAMAQLLGRGPAEAPPARPSTPAPRTGIESLGYIASPPADFPSVSAEAHRLYIEGAFLGSLKHDPALSLARFGQALEIARQKRHRPGEARLLYNMGVAHVRLGDLDTAIATFLEGKAVTEGAAGELGREARKVRRFEEEAKADDPTVEVFGVPQIDQQLLVMYLEALATVYEARSEVARAAECREAVKRLYRSGG
jgi:tetratricopeptide (TPR) repeat protein